MVVEQYMYVYPKDREYMRKSTFICQACGNVRFGIHLTLCGTVATNRGDPANIYISDRYSTEESRARRIGHDKQASGATTRTVIGGFAEVLQSTVYYESVKFKGCFYYRDPNRLFQVRCLGECRHNGWIDEHGRRYVVPGKL